jgi:hypothetical protein
MRSMAGVVWEERIGIDLPGVALHMGLVIGSLQW